MLLYPGSAVYKLCDIMWKMEVVRAVPSYDHREDCIWVFQSWQYWARKKHCVNMSSTCVRPEGRQGQIPSVFIALSLQLLTFIVKLLWFCWLQFLSHYMVTFLGIISAQFIEFMKICLVICILFKGKILKFGVEIDRPIDQSLVSVPFVFTP